MDILLQKFKYNPQDLEVKRQQALRNAYILYGFQGLRKKIESLNINNEIKKKDLGFLDVEERKINEI